jgi:hypothetical protein
MYIVIIPYDNRKRKAKSKIISSWWFAKEIEGPID